MTASPKARNTNALSHGLRSNRTVLPRRESEEEWQAHLAAITDSLEPVGPIERALAGDIAALLWRLERVSRYQVDAAKRASDTGGDPLAGLFDARVLNTILRAEAHLSRQLERVFDHLLDLQGRRREREFLVRLWA